MWKKYVKIRFWILVFTVRLLCALQCVHLRSGQTQTAFLMSPWFYQHQFITGRKHVRVLHFLLCSTSCIAGNVHLSCRTKAKVMQLTARLLKFQRRQQHHLPQDRMSGSTWKPHPCSLAHSKPNKEPHITHSSTEQYTTSTVILFWDEARLFELRLQVYSSWSHNCRVLRPQCHARYKASSSHRALWDLD